jgi:hypothetical protein
MITDDSDNNQVTILVKYLTGLSVKNDAIYTLYKTTLGDALNSPDRLTKMAFDRPFLLPFLDAGLAFVNPHADLRRRIYVVFAILESMPEYTDLFLPSKTTLKDLFVLIFTGMRAAFRAFIGILIIKVGRM